MFRLSARHIFLLLAYVVCCSFGTEIIRGMRIPLRDGVHVVADYYLPDEPGRYPAILEVTPYGRSSLYYTYVSESEHWTSNGYAFVLVDCRGEGDSEGEFNDVWQETNDIYDMLEWIVKESWSSGKVGMRGASYSGGNQLYAARSGSPHLTCITPSCAAENSPAMNTVIYRSGAFHLQWALDWIAHLPNSGINASIKPDWDTLLMHRPLYTADEDVYGEPLALYRRHLDHETADDYWKEIEIDEEEFSRIDIPSLTFTGWFDETQVGSIAHFKGLRKFSPSPEKHYLIIGPWAHYNAPDGGYDFITMEPILSIGDMQLPLNSVISGRTITTAFYNWCLKGTPLPPLPSNVMVYLTGSNIWLSLPDYPPQNTEVRSLFLSSSGDANSIRGNGKLVTQSPTEEPADEIIHDPLNPFKNYEKDLNGSYRTGFGPLPVDITRFLDRNDVLVYVSDGFQDSVTVLGRVNLKLYVSTDALDADFFAILEDVSPDGSSVKLEPRDSGLARARFRNGYETEAPVEPNVPFEVNLNMYDMGHTFLPGHKLRLSVMCSMYPKFFPNPGTGNSIVHDTAEPKITRNRVFHDSVRPSVLHFPVYIP